MSRVSKIDEVLNHGTDHEDGAKYRKNTKQALLSIVLEALPTLEGGAAVGKNYRTGHAKGNNDALDEMEANIRKVFGVEG